MQLYSYTHFLEHIIIAFGFSFLSLSLWGLFLFSLPLSSSHLWLIVIIYSLTFSV